jgi:phosphoglycolate phosphatase
MVIAPASVITFIAIGNRHFSGSAPLASGPVRRYLLGRMVRLVLFDIDGTLVRTGRAGVRAFTQVFATEFGIVDGVDGWKFAGRTDLSIVREHFTQHGIPATAENFERFFGRYAFWLDHLLRDSQTEVCAGVWELIRGLRQLPRPPLLGLLTGNIRLGAEIKLRHFDLWKEFETGAFGDDHEDRAQIAAIARRRGSRVLKEPLAGHQVVVVGDTHLDIRCARAIGAKTLAVATGGCSLAELQRHQPEWAVPNLTAVSPAEVAGA